MRCVWSDMHAYSYVDGAAEGEERESFARHLEVCPACRSAVEEATGIDALLRETITAMDPPPGFAARVAERSMIPRSAGWSVRSLFSWTPRRMAGLGVAAVLVLVLIAGALLAPAGTVAQVRQWLYFVPGIGITAADEATLVSRGPVVVRDQGLTLAVEALLSDGKTTRVEFRLNGLPGGKEGLKEKPEPATRAGAEPAPRVDPAPPADAARSKAMPVLRDASGRTYVLRGSSSGVGGSAQENVVKGEITFEPLSKGVTRVELVVPIEWMARMAPMSLVSEPRELVASIDLTHPARGGLKPAHEVGRETVANGVTVRALSVAFVDDSAVVQIEAKPADEKEQAIGLGGGLDSPELAATLKDGRGREYRTKPASGGIVPRPYRQSLTFPGTGGERGDLVLHVAKVRVLRDASASVSLPLSGRKAGEKFEIDRKVTLAGYEVRILTGELVQEGAGRWLTLDLDLGPAKGGRRLVSIQPRSGDEGSFSSSHDEGTGQISHIGFPVSESGDAQVTFSYPVFEVSGPWQVALPVSPE